MLYNEKVCHSGGKILKVLKYKIKFKNVKLASVGRINRWTGVESGMLARSPWDSQYVPEDKEASLERCQQHLQGNRDGLQGVAHCYREQS